MDIALLLPAALLLSAQDTPADDPNATSEDNIEVLVRSDLPRCNALRDDPLELVDVSRSTHLQSMMRPDDKGEMRLMSDINPITGPEVWQRAGRYLQDYVFRPSRNGSPMCIGSLRNRARGFAQYRQIYDATPYHGKYVRFTAFVATRRGHEVRFWFASGDKGRVYHGGDTANQPLTGTHGNWVPVSLTMGPISRSAENVSLGFLLMGPGIVWVTKPTFEAISKEEASQGSARFNTRKRERSSIRASD